jgi:hypothetical protein
MGVGNILNVDRDKDFLMVETYKYYTIETEIPEMRNSEAVVVLFNNMFETKTP